MKRKIRRRWRHFKYWMARKLLPKEELNFIGLYDAPEIKIAKITARRMFNSTNHEFFGEDRIQDIILSEMHDVLKKHLEVTEIHDEDNILVRGTLYIVKEEK